MALEYVWSDILIFIGIASIVIGSIFALTQENIKRLTSLFSYIKYRFYNFSYGLVSE